MSEDSRTFEVFADYFQFVLRDMKARWWETLADAWTDPQAQQDHFIRRSDFVVIGTARNVGVRVTIRVLAEPPREPQPIRTAGITER